MSRVPMFRRAPRVAAPKVPGALAGLAALALLAGPLPSLAGPAGVRVLTAGPGSVRFAVELPAATLTPLPFAPEVSELRVTGWDLLARPGDTQLPTRLFPVAVPPDGEVSVSARVIESETREGVILATQPFVPKDVGADPLADERVREGMLGHLAAAREAAGPFGAVRGVAPGRPAGPEAGPAPIARVQGVGWMRDQRVAQVELWPSSFDPAARRLTHARLVEVEVTWTVPAASSRAVLPGAVESGAFEGVYADVLVNAEQGKAWRRAGGAARAGLDGRLDAGEEARTAGASRLLGVTAVLDTSVYAGRRWLKIPITASGFYRINRNQVVGSITFSGATTPALDSLRMFTWPGYPILPEGDYCDTCDFREVAIQVMDDGDGIFDNNATDYIIFHAMGASDWGDLYDPSRPADEFVNNPYETRNYYYLGVGTAASPIGGTPRRFATANGAPGDPTGTVTPTTFRDRVHLERDEDYDPNPSPDAAQRPRYDVSATRTTPFWEKWFWNTVTDGATGGSFTVPAFDLPGYDASQPANVSLLTWGISTYSSARSPGILDHYAFAELNGVALARRGWSGRLPLRMDTTIAMAPTGNQVILRVPRVDDPNPNFNRNRFDQVALAWVQVSYPRRFEPVNDRLTFESPGNGDVIYQVEPFSDALGGPPVVYDVTDPLAPVEITSVEYDQTLGVNLNRLRFRALETGRRRYAILPLIGIATLTGGQIPDAPSSSLQNLRGRSQGADYLLIYYDGFRAAADELLRWRTGHLPPDVGAAPHDTASVPISALYDQFSGGRADPSAVRNFLRAIAQNWIKVPTYVTLLGDASYDYKNIKGQAPPGLPGSLLTTYEGGFDFFVNRQYATDDWLLNVDNPFTIIPDFIGGRVPAGDAASALVYVRDKLIPYESTAPTGAWRNTVMLVGDDNRQGGAGDGLVWAHVDQTATLDRFGLPRHFDRSYVYLHTYPTGLGFTKPGAKADIIAGVNAGVSLVNYIGHGSPFKLADESVLLDTDASAFTNAARPTVLVAASCDVGKFSDPLVPSLGERMVLNPVGGGIGVISATELAFSNQNAALNLTLYEQIYRRDAGTGLYSVALSRGLLAAKTGSQNNQKYQLMGDAALQLLLPKWSVASELFDAADQPAATVLRGQTVTVRGRVLERPGGPVMPLSGTIDLLIEDSAPVDTVPECEPLPGSPNDCETYPFRAAPLFRGDVPVLNGAFESRFVVPLDAKLGPRARVRAYVTGAGGAFDSDGAGADSFAIAVGTGPPTDVEGPRISLSFPGGSTTVRPDATLRIDLTDESGILITERTAQNGIVITIDDDSNQRTEVTSSFRYAEGSYQSGTATFQLPNLSPGPHRVTVSAADNLAVGLGAGLHRSTASIDFAVSDNPDLRVRRAFLFPNPVRSGGAGSGGTFVVDAPGDSINVMVRIYTVSGRLVRTLANFGALGQSQIPWDGLDEEGERLANGVYLFRVHANPREADGNSSARQAASAEGRIVVHRR